VTEAEPASAANGSPVLLGESNKAKGTTMITNKDDVALAGFTSASGFVGVFGADTSKDGGFGLYGLSDNGGGIYGSITGDTSGQVRAQSRALTAVQAAVMGFRACPPMATAFTENPPWTPGSE
jgi:hypothetical protein